MDAARHQEVARALGRRRRENGRRELVEARVLHAATHGIDDLHAGHDVVVELLAPEIEEAIFQALILGVFDVAKHRNREFSSSTQHFEIGHEHLDRAGGQVRVLRAGRARAHLAIHADHPFRAHLLGGLEGGAIGVHHDLRHAVMVAQIDEEHAAMVADAVAPAGEPGDGADIGGAKPAAGVGTVAMHRKGSLIRRKAPNPVEDPRLHENRGGQKRRQPPLSRLAPMESHECRSHAPRATRTSPK